MTLLTKQICKRLGQVLALSSGHLVAGRRHAILDMGRLDTQDQVERHRNDDGEKSASRKRLGRGASGSSGALASSARRTGVRICRVVHQQPPPCLSLTASRVASSYAARAL